MRKRYSSSELVMIYVIIVTCGGTAPSVCDVKYIYYYAQYCNA